MLARSAEGVLAAARHAHAVDVAEQPIEDEDVGDVVGIGSEIGGRGIECHPSSVAADRRIPTRPSQRLRAPGSDVDARRPRPARLVEGAIAIGVPIAEEDVDEIVGIGRHQVRGTRFERHEPTGGADHGVPAVAADGLAVRGRHAHAPEGAGAPVEDVDVGDAVGVGRHERAPRLEDHVAPVIAEGRPSRALQRPDDGRHVGERGRGRAVRGRDDDRRLSRRARRREEAQEPRAADEQRADRLIADGDGRATHREARAVHHDRRAARQQAARRREESEMLGGATIPPLRTAKM